MAEKGPPCTGSPGLAPAAAITTRPEGAATATHLSSTDVRLSISVITSAISYFSLCRDRERRLWG